MKKILMGLVAMSSLTYTVVDTGATPTEGTNIFTNLQTGKIVVEGTLTSDVPVVKYAVFATTDEGVTDKNEKLILSEFILKEISGTGGGFSQLNPKVMVKKLNSNTNAVEELDPTVEIEFFVNLDQFYRFYTESGQRWIKEGEKFVILSTALLSKQTLEEVVNALKGADASKPWEVVTEGSVGYLAIPSSFKGYRTTKQVVFTQASKGVLEISDEQTSIASHWGALTSDQINIISTSFAGGKNITNVFITVRIN